MRILSARPASLPALCALLALGACQSSTEPKRSPPVFMGFSVTPESEVEPGYSVTVTYDLSARSGLDRSVVSASGAFAFVDSARHDGLQAVEHSVRIAVPATASLTTPLQIVVDAYARDGSHSRKTVAPIAVVDRFPPKRVGLRLLSTQAYFLPGDTVRFTIVAEDNGQLRWIGYRLGTLADSLAVSASTAEWTVTRVLDPFPFGNVDVSLSAFAVDAAQLRSTVSGMVLHMGAPGAGSVASSRQRGR